MLQGPRAALGALPPLGPDLQAGGARPRPWGRGTETAGPTMDRPLLVNQAVSLVQHEESDGAPGSSVPRWDQVADAHCKPGQVGESTGGGCRGGPVWQALPPMGRLVTLMHPHTVLLLLLLAAAAAAAATTKRRKLPVSPGRWFTLQPASQPPPSHATHVCKQPVCGPRMLLMMLSVRQRAVHCFGAHSAQQSVQGQQVPRCRWNLSMQLELAEP